MWHWKRTAGSSAGRGVPPGGPAHSRAAPVTEPPRRIRHRRALCGGRLRLAPSPNDRCAWGALPADMHDRLTPQRHYVLPRAFDRFYRAAPASHAHGSGLGLAIVAAVAATHNGTAKATLNEPHGCASPSSCPHTASPRPARRWLPVRPPGVSASAAEGRQHIAGGADPPPAPDSHAPPGTPALLTRT